MKELIENKLKQGISQRELAKKITISQGTLQNILFTSTKITYETRKKVADYFGVPVSDFYDNIITAQGDMKKGEGGKINEEQEGGAEMTKILVEKFAEANQEIGMLREKIRNLESGKMVQREKNSGGV